MIVRCLVTPVYVFVLASFWNLSHAVIPQFKFQHPFRGLKSHAKASHNILDNANANTEQPVTMHFRKERAVDLAPAALYGARPQKPKEPEPGGPDPEDYPYNDEVSHFDPENRFADIGIAVLDATVPKYDLSKLGGTASEGDICDRPLYDEFIIKIYNDVKARQSYDEAEEALVVHLNAHPPLRRESCYGYIPQTKRRGQSRILNYMECRTIQGTKGKCRCLDSHSTNSTMIHQKRKGRHKGRFCVHPIDVLNSCDHKEWKKQMGNRFHSILRRHLKNKKGRTSWSTFEALSTEMKGLVQSVRENYKNDPKKLKNICFTDDFSLVCNKRGYCTCQRHDAHFNFIRSHRVDRCIPVNGTYCNTLGESDLDECAHSPCVKVFPNTTFQACGGLEAWENANIGPGILNASTETVFGLFALYLYATLGLP